MLIPAEAQTPGVLKNKIKQTMDVLDTDQLKEVFDVIAGMAADRAAKFAEIDWIESGLSREQIKNEVDNYRPHSINEIKLDTNVMVESITKKCT